MQVAITGGAGFIGSHVAERFAQQGHQVRVLDNLSSGSASNLHPAWQFLRGDVCHPAEVDQVVSGTQVVVHLAAFTSVPESFARFRECYQVNVGGTYNVLEACATHRVRKLVFASTSAVYAAAPDTPKLEDDCPEPISPYGVSKLEGEHLLQPFENHRGLPSVALRFFNVYGPRQPVDSAYAAVIPAFIQRSLKGQSLTIYGDGHQTRDFVFVGDVAEAVYRAALSRATGVYNVGTGRGVAVLALADTIGQMFGARLPHTFAPPQPGDVRSSTADIKHIRRTLGWSPVYSLEQGLKETFEWYQRRNTAHTA